MRIPLARARRGEFDSLRVVTFSRKTCQSGSALGSSSLSPWGADRVGPPAGWDPGHLSLLCQGCPFPHPAGETRVNVPARWRRAAAGWGSRILREARFLSLSSRDLPTRAVSWRERGLRLAALFVDVRPKESHQRVSETKSWGYC